MKSHSLPVTFQVKLGYCFSLLKSTNLKTKVPELSLKIIVHHHRPPTTFQSSFRFFVSVHQAQLSKNSFVFPIFQNSEQFEILFKLSVFELDSDAALTHLGF